MSTNPQIEQLLNTLKAHGRSSPAGTYWQQFHELLRSKKPPGRKDPPVPLILAASGESNGSKHRRLLCQLEWAVENGCLDDAIRYLNDVPANQWSSGSLDQWDQDTY